MTTDKDNPTSSKTSPDGRLDESDERPTDDDAEDSAATAPPGEGSGGEVAVEEGATSDDGPLAEDGAEERFFTRARLQSDLADELPGFGSPVPDDYVDPELESAPASTGFIQPLLFLSVLFLSVFMGTQYVGELRYYFSPHEPIDLGRADELRLQEEWMDGRQLELPSNRYAAIEGVVERRSTSPEKMYFKLVGAPVYVEQARDDEDRPRILRELPMRVEHGEESYRPYFDAGGRLLSFRTMPVRYSGVAAFYAQNYRTHFCGHEPSIELQRYLHNRRESARLAMSEDLGRGPTDQELDERLGDEAECVEAYLLIAGENPADYWYFVVIYILLVLFGASSIYLLYRWTRRWLLLRSAPS